jgi:hypothetical protein
MNLTDEVLTYLGGQGYFLTNDEQAGLGSLLVVAESAAEAHKECLKPKPDVVRVLKLVEFVGERKAVEEQLSMGLGEGTRNLTRHGKGVCIINSAVVGSYPELLENLPIRFQPSGQTEAIVSEVLKHWHDVESTDAGRSGDEKIAMVARRLAGKLQ